MIKGFLFKIWILKISFCKILKEKNLSKLNIWINVNKIEEEENKQNEENKNIDNDKEPDPRINLLRLIISLFGRLYF